MRSPTLAVSASAVSIWPWVHHLHAINLSSPCRTTLTVQPRIRTIPPICRCASPKGDENDQVERSLADSSSATECNSSSPSRKTCGQLLALGRSHATAGDLEFAVQAFELAVALEPRSASARADLGRALLRSGRRSKGFDNLVAAFEIDSLCLGVKDGFREYYEAEIKANPADIDLHEGLAALYVDSGLAEEAAACYRRCLELSFPSPSGPSSPAVVDAARIERWSVALFKCHASVCHWDSWRTEARALQEAVGRRQSGAGSPPRPDVQGNGDRDELLWLGFDSLDVLISELSAAGSGSGVIAEGSAEDTMTPSASAAAAASTLTGSSFTDGNDCEQSCGSRISVGSGVIVTKTDDLAASREGGGWDVMSRPPLHPFDSLSAPLSIGDCLAVAQQQSRLVLAERGAKVNGYRDWVLEDRRVLPSLRDSKGRVRLGYVSGDLMGTHPLTHLMQSVFGMHDKGEFEVFLYALNPDDGSHRRRRMEREVEHFRDVSALTAREAAAAIAEDGIGVLVNLNGYAGTAKSADVFALRPAPVAVSYMGFPGTMGSPEMVDYILADGVVIPGDMRRFYSEKVLEMPHCYFVNDYQQSERDVLEEEAPVTSRAEHGLPPGGDGYDVIACSVSEPGELFGEDCVPCTRPGVSEVVVGVERAGDGAKLETAVEVEEGEVEGEGNVVLCNFNRLHKIDPYTFDAWMEVLKNVPGTVLWLLDGGATARANLRRYAGLAGVGEDRIVFAPLIGKTDHLRRLRLADVFVDTPLYNAHTVGCDALWAGVPMVTLRGTKMASRVGASLVEAAGVPELVTESMSEYARLVEDLARDGRRRRSLRLKLERARLTCPLFDTRRWVRDAERLIIWACERHEAGLPPEHHRAGVMSGVDAGVD